jgi:acyl-coenzyme A thioesterase PaaI-like protein
VLTRLKLKPATLRRLMNLWPPYLAAGIVVEEIRADYRYVRVALKDRVANRNYFGTHFGGSLFAMTDPFYALMLFHQLGRDYVVWDQAGKIHFERPGRGTVRCEFHLDDATLADIRAAADDGSKVLRWLPVEIRNGADELVARVEKQVYVRKKPQRTAVTPVG